jgi:phosphohistidine phosphatase SixA
MLLHLTAILLFLLPLSAHADGMSALREPGAIALMRHAIAPGGGDPAGFVLGDCTTQRNLDGRGREQARRTGEALRAAGISFDAVWSSGWCRCIETAELMAMGPVEIRPSLHSFFSNRADGPAQTRETLAAIAAAPDATRLLLVTHQVNITALTGITPQSGEIIVVQRRSDGGLEVSGRISFAP